MGLHYAVNQVLVQNLEILRQQMVQFLFVLLYLDFQLI